MQNSLEFIWELFWLIFSKKNHLVVGFFIFPVSQTKTNSPVTWGQQRKGVSREIRKVKIAKIEQCPDEGRSEWDIDVKTIKGGNNIMG